MKVLLKIDDKLLSEKKQDIMQNIINYMNISKIKYSPEMKLIIDALEAIMTGKTNSVLHDYIYIKQKIISNI